MTERARYLRAIRKCLSDTHRLFKETMDIIDEMGRASLATGMTSLIGGYGMSDPNRQYRAALIKLDQAEKSLAPLSKRVREGMINENYFIDREALVLLRDVTEFEYQLLIRYLAQRRGRETVWYRLNELNKKIERLLEMVADE